MADALNKDERMARARKARRKGGKRTTRSCFRLEGKKSDGTVVDLGTMFRKVDAEAFDKIVQKYPLKGIEKVRFVRIITSNVDW